MDRTNALLYALLLAVVGTAVFLGAERALAPVGGLLLLGALLLGTAAFFAEFDEATPSGASREPTENRTESDD